MEAGTGAILFKVHNHHWNSFELLDGQNVSSAPCAIDFLLVVEKWILIFYFFLHLHCSSLIKLLTTPLIASILNYSHKILILYSPQMLYVQLNLIILWNSSHSEMWFWNLWLSPIHFLDLRGGLMWAETPSLSFRLFPEITRPSGAAALQQLQPLPLSRHLVHEGRV